MNSKMPPDRYSFGLVGYPLGHSLSPKIHKAALNTLRFKGNYDLYPIPPLPEGGQALANLLSQTKQGKIHGLSVTIPHKQNVITLLDQLTPSAEAIGAVNTIFLDDDKLVGDNTDAPGFFSDLESFIANHPSINIPKSPSALVLGAGGGARAVVYALLTHGYSITIAARRIEQAQEISMHFSKFSPKINMMAINNLPYDAEACSLIVNTTPVGMHPRVDDSPWPDGVPFPKGAAVYDLVYNPRETRLIRQARAVGLPATTGLGMLVEQAVLAFERWTEFEAPRDVMYASVNY